MRRAFKMKLHKGNEQEYLRRHDQIWPELKELLSSSGIKEYSIFLDSKTNTLFGVMQVHNEEALKRLPEHPVMKKWWAYMRDLMDTNADNSPVTVDLKEVFYLK